MIGSNHAPDIPATPQATSQVRAVVEGLDFFALGSQRRDDPFPRRAEEHVLDWIKGEY
jgi:hypothetical protein